MPKLKIPRKSTSIDMTAMCDVAFLLLSFFIFTAKFKKTEEVAIQTPTAVTTDKVDTLKKINVTCEISPKGAILMGIDGESNMEALGEALNQDNNLQLTPQELQVFSKKTSVGVPLEELKSFLANTARGAKPEITGIVLKDTTENQLKNWINAVVKVKNLPGNADKDINVFIRADKLTPFDVVDKVMMTWTKLGLDQFKLVTLPKDIPAGTEYYEKRKQSTPADAE